MDKQDANHHDLKCTRAYVLWASYVRLLVDPNATESDWRAPFQAALNMIPGASDPMVSFSPGGLAFLDNGRKFYFAHHYDSNAPLAVAVFAEDGDPYSPIERPDVIRAANKGEFTPIE